ncbi:unnamed protein product [Closterium sp. Naga37s-1]|nr:unnamed protein product [Closterium sp. Naga37s-1]
MRPQNPPPGWRPSPPGAAPPYGPPPGTAPPARPGFPPGQHPPQQPGFPRGPPSLGQVPPGAPGSAQPPGARPAGPPFPGGPFAGPPPGSRPAGPPPPGVAPPGARGPPAGFPGPPAGFQGPPAGGPPGGAARPPGPFAGPPGGGPRPGGPPPGSAPPGAAPPGAPRPSGPPSGYPGAPQQYPGYPPQQAPPPPAQSRPPPTGPAPYGPPSYGAPPQPAQPGAPLNAPGGPPPPFGAPHPPPGAAPPSWGGAATQSAPPTQQMSALAMGSPPPTIPGQYGGPPGSTPGQYAQHTPPPPGSAPGQYGQHAPPPPFSAAPPTGPPPGGAMMPGAGPPPPFGAPPTAGAAQRRAYPMPAGTVTPGRGRAPPVPWNAAALPWDGRARQPMAPFTGLRAWARPPSPRAWAGMRPPPPGWVRGSPWRPSQPRRRGSRGPRPNLPHQPLFLPHLLQPPGVGAPPQSPGMGAHPPSPGMGARQPMAPFTGQAAGQQGSAPGSRIDPNQIPRPPPPADAFLFETRVNGTANLPPVSAASLLAPAAATSSFVVRDTGNCSPRFIRASLNQIPLSADLLTTSAMPLSIMIQPFALQDPADTPVHPFALQDPADTPVHVVDFGEMGPVRCHRCKAYINPFMRFVDHGRKFICNLCGVSNETPREYVCNLGPDGRRRDADERPELMHGSVEFVAPKEYSVSAAVGSSVDLLLELPLQPLLPLLSCHFPSSKSAALSSLFVHPIPPALIQIRDAMPPVYFFLLDIRDAMPPVYFFLLDVSFNAVASGAASAACSSISRILQDLPEGGRTLVAFATFNSTIQFYSLNSSLAQPSMLVVPEVEDVYTPLPSDLIVPLDEAQERLQQLLESIPQMFAETRVADSCLGAALQGAFLAMKKTGGRILAFQSVLPSVGIGSLSSREAEGRANATVADKDVLKLLQPNDKQLRPMAEEMADFQVAVDVFLTSQGFADAASIAVIPRITGGQLYSYYPFSAAHDGGKLHNDLRWAVRRPHTFEGVMKVRCSQGLSVSDYFGNFHRRIPAEIYLPAMDSDKAIMATVKHDEKLAENSEACFQCAILYTTTTGERRVRVHTLSLPTTASLASVFRGADLDAQFAYMLKTAAADVVTHPVQPVRDAAVQTAVSILYTYRKFCATASSSGQLILPEALKLLPLYTLALLKSQGLRGDVKVDERSAWLARVRPLSASLSVPLVYPRLFALHHLLKDAANQEQQKQQNGTEEEQQHEHLPSALPLSSEKLEPDGVFLVENGEEAVVWEQQKQQNGTEEEQQHEHLPSALPLSSEKLEPDGVFLVENGEEAVVWVGREADSHLLFYLFGLRSVDEIAPGPFLLQEFDNPASRKLNAIVNEIRRQRCSYLRMSATRVALDVLGPRYNATFNVMPVVEVVPCNSEDAAVAAERLDLMNVVGVVGPACSEAVKGANSVLQPKGISYVSFAATADVFNTPDYNTFFRTVFADKHQAREIAALIRFFQFDEVHLFYSNEIYGSDLASKIRAELDGSLIPVSTIPVSYPVDEFAPLFADVAVGERSICVLAALPAVAEGFWRAAVRENFTSYPWWYLGTDGVAALDFVDQSGERLGGMARSLQGEMAVGPNMPFESPNLRPFTNHWKKQAADDYVGLINAPTTPKYNETRLYVAHLIDSIWAFFEAFRNIIAVQNRAVTVQAVLECFRNQPAGCGRFEGASGTVAFNTVTGERLKLDGVPAYSLYNLIGKTWKEKPKWVLNGSDGVKLMDPTDYVTRPGPLPAGSLLPLQHQIVAP